MQPLQIGRYYLAGANTTYNSYERIKCEKSVVHPGWSVKHGRNDISLCFLASASRFTPVTLSKGEQFEGCRKDIAYRLCLQRIV